MAGQSDEAFERTLVLDDASASGIGTARRFVADGLQAMVPSRTEKVIELVTSELVSNAVVHGCGGQVSLTVRSQGQEVSVEVVNEIGPGTYVADLKDWNMQADPAALSGRGLAIVRLLSQRVEARRATRQLTVTAYFRRDR